MPHIWVCHKLISLCHKLCMYNRCLTESLNFPFSSLIYKKNPESSHINNDAINGKKNFSITVMRDFVPIQYAQHTNLIVCFNAACGKL